MNPGTKSRHMMNITPNGPRTIPEHFEPGPARPAGLARARPAHEPYWTGMGRDHEACEFFLARAWPEMLFFVVIKCAGGPPKPEPGTSQNRKLRLEAPSGMVMGGIFSA
jgi:hypothetical protein